MAIKISNNTVIDNSQNWTGSTIPVSKGGTGATTLSGVLIGNGTNPITTKTNPVGNFVGTTDTQTLTNKTFSTINVVGDQLWDSFSSWRIVKYDYYLDPSNYAPATAGYGSSLTIVPTRANTTVIGVVSNMIAAGIDGNTEGDAGCSVVLYWYDGAAYVTGSFNSVATLQTSGGLTSGSTHSNGSIYFKLTSSQRRTDTGDWFLRTYVARSYSGNSCSSNSIAWTWWEIEE